MQMCVLGLHGLKVSLEYVQRGPGSVTLGAVWIEYSLDAIQRDANFGK